MAGKRTEQLQRLLAPAAPEALATWIQRYLETLQTQHRSVADQRTRRSRLAHFHAWCLDQELTTPAQVTHMTMERFQRHLFLYRKANGAPIAINGQRVALFTIEMFFRWLVRHQVVTSNPVADLELPKRTDDLREPLTLAEVATVLALPNLATPEGLRDRVVLEVLYATGLRRAEVTHLAVSDLDRERGTLHVRLGKGRKDRFVPVGERALAWIAKYEREARPVLLAEPGERRLFLNQYGQPLSPDGLSWRVRDYFRQAGIEKRGACHLFRHTMATAMLDNGADIRHIQEILGHGQITSTQRYTHVSIARLKAVHTATHPAARLHRDLDDPQD
ncbi:site-specific tyrosine recombinase XerC [Rhodanobacter sp. AS-Z3]|uniref:site-specific tyrosine recombinase XerC n=1 Tax=Rhodanobacter sp. AS-Z3 TaxID=3031330 RepID=UPI00247A2BA3|nr:site-specific tyrosine recombinase XerC [Rhodanobacter sp. AS-Z3]WEN15578.1 site-specific tyrosine recombinase XerC [Rhodanobacter sp. AS-Z3]WEN15585.1 site-specific tyrosine recombinase XerC [Rhodanobacter sp. AS-Z3]WEN15591.1 site-specific tyrosine recombinase XerC [Rhodanobacter sp. AS-Z3]